MILPIWSTRAVNLAEHGDNPVHTEEGGRAAGYAGAVVAGTTIYAYLTRPVAQKWGLDWVSGGGAEVRFRAAVLADEQVDIVADGDDLAARVGDRTCAELTPAAHADGIGAPEGDRLEPMVAILDEQLAEYGTRVGEDLTLYRDHNIVHPVSWLSLSNRVFSLQLADGAWVHTRSRVAHLGLARPFDTAVVEPFLLRRFDSRAGERAVCDIRISVDGRPVAAVEHEAIVALG